MAEQSADGNRYIACGFHAVQAAISRGGQVIEVFIDKERDDARMRRIIALANHHNVSTNKVKRLELDRRSGGVKHQGVIAKLSRQSGIVAADPLSFVQQLATPPLLLALDQVQDPHNLGACLRVADGAGVDAVILPKDGAAPINETVSRVSAGAVEYLTIFRVTNLSRSLEQLKQHGLWVMGAADESAQPFYQMNLTAPTVMVLGTEAKGLRRLTRESCDHLVSLPMQGGVSSLNVSVACGIMLYEAVRQRQI